MKPEPPEGCGQAIGEKGNRHGENQKLVAVIHELFEAEASQIAKDHDHC